MTKTTTLKAVLGLRNNTTPERFAIGDLAVGENVDIDSSGRITRRKGYVNISPGSMHSLWASPSDCFVVNNQMLHRVLSDLTLQPLYFVTAGTRLTYASVGNVTYFSDELTTGAVMADGRVRAWGFQTPDTPNASATAGDLPPGAYQYAMTLVRDDGFESGASRARVTTLSAPGGLQWDELPEHGDAAKVRIYLSQANSEILYHAGDFPATGAGTVIRGILHRGVRLRSQFMDAPPAGLVFGPWMGRIFIAHGQFVSFTQPFEYELIAPRTNWWAFDDAISTMAFVDDGVFVGTVKKTYFLQGGDPASVSVAEVCGYGTVRGTEAVLRPDLVSEGAAGQRIACWMSTKGVCVGLTGGRVINLTGERFQTPDALYGAGVFVEQHGLPQYRVSLLNYPGEADTGLA